jgi:hypothetical protein
MKVWVLYDGRAEFEDEHEAMVLEMADSRKELKNMLYYNEGEDGVLFEYDTHEERLVNGRNLGHLREGIRALLDRSSLQGC